VLSVTADAAADLGRALKDRLCAIGLRSGVRLRASVRVGFRSAEPGVSFSCEGGSVVP